MLELTEEQPAGLLQPFVPQLVPQDGNPEHNDSHTKINKNKLLVGAKQFTNTEDERQTNQQISKQTNVLTI